MAEIVARAAGPANVDIRLFVEPHPGISAARNRAFAEAEAAGVALLAMLDDDEWPRAGWLAALLERRRETGAVAVSGIVEPRFPEGARGLERYREFWSVLPQQRDGKPFIHATSNVLIDLEAIRDVPRPLFDDAYGLSGGGDLVFFSRLFDLGKPMAWTERAVALEEVPQARASWDWLRRRRFRVGNHMVMDEELRLGRLRPMLKTAGLAVRFAVYPLLGREPRARLAGWRMEAVKLRGRIAAHLGLRAFEYTRDGGGLRTAVARGEVTPAGQCPVDPATVVVGIPTLNEKPHIEACVRGLIGDDPWMREVAVVIADGGSMDGTQDVVRGLLGEFPNLRLLANPKRLQAAALNLIVAEAATAAHAFLVRCDAHAIYPSGYVRDTVERLARLEGDVAAVATVMDAQGTGGFGRAAAWAVDTSLGSGGSAHRGGRRSGFVEHGHHAAFRLDWFRRVGGYDESFRHNEDAELDHRLRDAGARIWLAAGLRLGYRVRESIGELAAQYLQLRARTRAEPVETQGRSPPPANPSDGVVDRHGALCDWRDGAAVAAAVARLLLWPASCGRPLVRRGNSFPVRVVGRSGAGGDSQRLGDGVYRRVRRPVPGGAQAGRTSGEQRYRSDAGGVAVPRFGEAGEHDGEGEDA